MKGIIFDFGHTLMYFDGDWEEVTAAGKNALVAFLKQEGLRVPESFGESFIRKRDQGEVRSDHTGLEYTAEQCLRETLAGFGMDGYVKPLIPEALKAFFAPELSAWKLFPDALPALTELRRRGFRVGLTPNATDHPFIMDCVEKFGIRAYLDPIVSSAAFSFRKPDPKIFLHVAHGWEIDPQDIMVIGDQPYFDIYGAHQAGMQSVWMKRDFRKSHAFIPPHLKEDPWLNPDHTIESMAELLEMLPG